MEKTKTKIVKYVSNTFTFGNMAAGLLSVLLLLYDDRFFPISSGLILLGGVFDFFDGFFARRWDSETDFGKQLDSFADIITFGIAPLVLLNVLYPSVWIAIASLMYLLSGAYRLARYNLDDFSRHFIGLPITMAGILLTVFCVAQLLWLTGQHSYIIFIVTIIFVILLSVAMVSKKKVKRFRAER